MPHFEKTNRNEKRKNEQRNEGKIHSHTASFIHLAHIPLAAIHEPATHAHTLSHPYVRRTENIKMLQRRRTDMYEK